MINMNLTKLNSTFDFKMSLDTQMFHLHNSNVNSCSKEQFRLYNYISENLRMNLRYWSNCNLDYYTNFSGIYRNLRYSIESFYDLFNLICHESYISVLKNNSSNAMMKAIDKCNLENNYREYKLDCNHYFTIKDKANIATSKNRLKLDIQNRLKEISIIGSRNAHPDVYQPDVINKLEVVEELMNFEHLILFYAAGVCIFSYDEKNNTNYYFNLYQDFLRFKNFNTSLPTVIYS